MGETAKKLEAAMPYVLVNELSGQAYVLFDGFRVGRGTGDLALPDGSVSSNHCVFHLNGKALEIEDVGSRNGTFVGGKKLEPKSRVGLMPGVKVEIGNQAYLIQIGAEGGGAESPYKVELASIGSQLAAPAMVSVTPVQRWRGGSERPIVVPTDKANASAPARGAAASAATRTTLAFAPGIKPVGRSGLAAWIKAKPAALVAAAVVAIALGALLLLAHHGVPRTQNDSGAAASPK